MNPLSRAWFSTKSRSLGASFWVARYYAGDEIWEPECDWSLIPRDNLTELRLHCPNGQVGVLGNTESLNDRAWQTKTAVVQVGGTLGMGRKLLSQTIGIHDPESNYSTTYTWDYTTGRLMGPDSTLTPPLSFDVVGIKD